MSLQPRSAGLGPVPVALLLGALIGLSGMGTTAVAVALPDMVQHFHVPTDRGVWVISAYAISLAVGTALYGRAADNAGVRTPITVGAVLLAVGALLAALSPSYGTLIGARRVQGAGAGAAPVLTLATLRVMYDGPVRSTALGHLAGTAVAVTALGPVAGGLLTDTFGWEAAMLFPALSLLVVSALWRTLPSGGTGARLDYPGALLVAGTAAGLVLVVQSPSIGRHALLGGAVLLALGVPAVLVRVRRRPEGFLPRAVLREPVVLRSALGAAALPASFFGLLVAIPAVLSAAGWSPLGIGFALLPGALVGIFVSRYVGRVLERIGARRSIAVAAATCVVSVLLAALGASGAPVLMMVAMAGVYSGFTIGQPAMAAAVAEAVPPGMDGVALGLATLVFFVGGGLGAAVAGLGAVVGHPWSLVLLALLPVAATVVVSRRPPPRAPSPAG
jgi:MFS family permease